MADIIIYTRPEVLEHKLSLCDCWWDLPTIPRREFADESLLYVAVKGSIIGSFMIDRVIDERVEFYAGSWELLKEPIPQKPFQGYKYFDNLKKA